MTKALLKVVQDQITESIDSMLDRRLGLRSYLDRVVYPKYQNAQRQRWMTQGASEGAKWPPITSRRYQEWKRKRYAAAFGKGNLLMIASNRLQDSVSGTNYSGVAVANARAENKEELKAVRDKAGKTELRKSHRERIKRLTEEFRSGRSYHRKIVTDRSIQIGTTLPYAGFAAEERPFMEFGEKTMTDITDGLAAFVMEGLLK